VCPSTSMKGGVSTSEIGAKLPGLTSNKPITPRAGWRALQPGSIYGV